MLLVGSAAGFSRGRLDSSSFAAHSFRLRVVIIFVSRGGRRQEANTEHLLL